jgi:hypothetical protein
MQIEHAKGRDMVNIYGGLGKVGLDHQGVINEDGGESKEEVPGFSASALKYIKKVKVIGSDDEEEDEEEDGLLIGSSQEMRDELGKIDEEVKEDDEDEKKEEVKVVEND